MPPLNTILARIAGINTNMLMPTATWDFTTKKGAGAGLGLVWFWSDMAGSFPESWVAARDVA